MRFAIPLVLLSLSVGADVFPADSSFGKFTGHDWRKYNQTAKVYYLRGFLDGNTLGRLQEVESDMTTALKWVMDKLCSEKKQDVCDAVMRLFADKTNEEEIENVALKKEPIRLNKPLGYFISELDSFYDAYPLCRGKSLAMTLAQLVNVWAGSRENSYQTVGAACGK